MNAGPDTHELIDQEVRKLVDEGYETAKRILTEKRDDLDRLANGLLEYETLTGKEITRVIHGQPLNRGGDDDDDGKDDGAAASPSIPKTGKSAAPGARRRRPGARAGGLTAGRPGTPRGGRRSPARHSRAELDPAFTSRHTCRDSELPSGRQDGAAVRRDDHGHDRARLRDRARCC